MRCCSRSSPFETQVALVQGDDLRRLVADEPFGAEPPAAGVVRFASFLVEPTRIQPSLPVVLSASGDWLVRIVALDGGVAFGEYRRDKRTIGFLGQVDRLVGVPVTTRNWNTVNTIVRLLNAT